MENLIFNYHGNRPSLPTSVDQPETFMDPAKISRPHQPLDRSAKEWSVSTF